jgi:oligosaccharide repeat unit polymerase
MIISVLLTSYKEGGLIGFFPIADLFIGMMFVVRPIQLLLAGDVNLFSVIKRYSTYYYEVSAADLPWAKAALIGFIGVVFLNFPFLISDKKDRFTVKNASDYTENYYFSRKQMTGILLFTLVAMASAGAYAYKVMRTSTLHIYDRLWVFVFSCLIIYIISRKRTADVFIYLIIALSMILLSFRGRRQYAVNMLICYICPLYFVGKNRKRTFFKVSIMLIAVLAIIFIYGNIRRELRGGILKDSIVDGILSEFCMFDMLLIALDYVKVHGIGLFWGYNYLCLFTYPIPGITIQPFDHFFTGLIYQGRMHGGIPTSIFGSLFLNFSFIGLGIGSLLLGILLSWIQKKLSVIRDYHSIGYYSIVATFVYDIVRVGDIGREAWSLFIFLLVYYVFSYIIKRIAPEYGQIQKG